MVYTFRNRCDEDYSIILPDEAAKIIINTKGTVGNVSPELRAVIQYMDSGLASTEYTKSLDEEVVSVKADEKVRREYMLLMEAFAMREDTGKHMTIVSQIRDAVNELTVQKMAKFFKVTEKDCRAVLDCIRDHPDWDDRQIAEEIYWEDD